MSFTSEDKQNNTETHTPGAKFPVAGGKDNDYELGMKLWDLFSMLEKANKDIKDNKRKKELLKSI